MTTPDTTHLRSLVAACNVLIDNACETDVGDAGEVDYEVEIAGCTFDEFVAAVRDAEKAIRAAIAKETP